MLHRSHVYEEIEIQNRSPSRLSPAPVLKEEDSKAYDDLLTQVSSCVKPTNIMEDFWVRDVVDLRWEILRYRRYKQQVIEAVGSESALN